MSKNEVVPSATEGGDLPGYSRVESRSAASSSREQPLTEHVSSLDHNGKVWLSLRVKSRSTSSSVLPLFFDGDTITGSVELNLEKPESAKAVTISILGEVTTVGQDGVTFLDVSSVLWTPTNGSKLNGQQKWPFTLTIPKESTIPLSDSSKEKPKLFPLPPSYSTKSSPAYIDYKLVVTVKRGTFKVNNVVSTNFGYLTRVRALSPLATRLSAYSAGKNAPGPDIDTEGWKVFPSTTVKGTLFDTKSISVDVILAVALPLSYAIGSPIPLFVTIRCDDGQALDLLAQSSALNVYLTRSITLGSDASDDTAQRRSNNTFLENVGRAYFWAAESGIQESGVKVLQGEIDISKGLKPTFVFPRFSLRYSLNMYPLRAAGFVPAHPMNQPLISEKVSIAAENAPGVVTRSMAPPGYVREEAPDFNVTIGYLENGNQRFYHHSGGV